ncbi:MAG: YihA family ribosome biogenesis GTP-binding protein [candidate division Zixibacteria bacterium]|nr:YihA family ribosome biogenesis GTP-binding protein [candidate division Zixibacteria bacterium]
MTPGRIDCRFVGSFYELKQLPQDRRQQIAFAGRSNVGKSTLLNRLAGRRKLAKVSATPGKTQSLNFFLVNDGFYFVDLPGYGYARVPKQVKAGWGKLIEDYLLGGDALTGLILLLDCRRDPTAEDYQLMSWLQQRELPVIVVVTKADKLNRDKVRRKVAQVEDQFGVAAVAFSSLSGQGKRELLAAIHDLVSGKL